MPRISAFYGIVVWMYWDDDDHPVPHFHARYGGVWASIAIDGPRVLAGQLPRRAQRLVFEWARLHQQELLANWQRARLGEPLERIAPLP
jgi:hypothetical protein